MTVPFWLPLLLGFLSAVGPLATDMYLPGLPSIEHDFAAIPGASQITLATWLFGLGIGQVLQGTLSDRFGRRGPLLAGMALFTASSIGCATADSMTSLAIWRAIGAIGGSAGMVIPRAIVRDHVTGNRAARMMSQQMLVMGAAPILAPSLGGLLIAWTGWRGIFWFQVGFGVLSIALSALLLPDSLAPEHRMRVDLAGLLKRFLNILREPIFRAHALIAGAVALSVFAYLGGVPGIYEHRFGLTPVQSGEMFGSNALAFIIATQINGLLAVRVGSPRLLGYGVIGFSIGGIGVVAFCFGALSGFWGLTIPLTTMLFSTGLMAPNTAVGALAKHATQAGSASALLGTVQYGLGAIGGALVAMLANGSNIPMGLVITASIVLAVYAARSRPN